MESPTGLSKALKRCFPAFNSVPPHFFLHRNPLTPPPQWNKQDFNKSWEASSCVIFPFQGKFPLLEIGLFYPHSETPHPKGTCSFNRLWCSLLNGILAWTELFIKDFWFWWSPLFPNLHLPNAISPTRYMQFLQSSTLSPLPETSPRDTWTQLLATSLISFNPLQYESNHQKQHLLIATSNISHCLPQLQILKS